MRAVYSYAGAVFDDLARFFNAHHVGDAAFPGNDGCSAKTFSHFVLGGESPESIDKISIPLENGFRLNKSETGFYFFRVRAQR